jgi:hypothetical protein
MYDYQFDSTEEIDLIDYSYNIFKHIDVNKPNLKEFIYKVSTLYNDNYFHNFEHAVNVLHMTFVLLNDTNLISKLDKDIKFGLLLSALCHDIDHPGNTNFYEIYTNSERAKLYNNISVLENHHCKVTFNQLDIFFNQINEIIKETITVCILGTDMINHDQIIHDFELFDFSKDTFTMEEQFFISKMILHYADLSNVIKKFKDYYVWSKRLSLEYYYESLKQNLEDDVKLYEDETVTNSEINFINNVTKPMWKLFTIKFKDLDFINDFIQDNLDKLNKLEESRDFYINENFCL